MNMPITEALRQHPELIEDAKTWLPWRVGRKVGRTIYVQVGEQPSDEDQLIGMMDEPKLATEAVACHNLMLEHVQSPNFGR